jgi:hypothetical protein
MELSKDGKEVFERLDKELENNPKYQMAIKNALSALKMENRAQT